MGVAEISVGNFLEKSNFSGNFERLVDMATGQQKCLRGTSIMYVKRENWFGRKILDHKIDPIL